MGIFYMFCFLHACVSLSSSMAPAPTHTRTRTTRICKQAYQSASVDANREALSYTYTQTRLISNNFAFIIGYRAYDTNEFWNYLHIKRMVLDDNLEIIVTLENLKKKDLERDANTIVR